MERSALVLLLLLAVSCTIGAAYDSWQELDELLVKRAEGDSCVHEGKTYPDGASFMIDCNTCTCTNGVAACTEMACEETLGELFVKRAEGDSCVHDGKTYPDGASFMIDCNTCTCANGVPACTKMACSEPNCTCTRGDRSFSCGQKIMARPNTTCTCLPNNQIGCQIMPNPVPDRCFFNNRFYMRRQRFRQGRCNRCACIGGNLVVCSMIDCRNPPKREPGCTYKGNTYKKGERFSEDCNRCDCVSNYVACTQLICVPPDTPPQPVQREEPWEWVGPN